MIYQKQLENKNLISRDDFINLTKVNEQNCVSFYIPTSRAGEVVDQNHSQIILKNCIKKVKFKLKDYELSDSEINTYLEPVVGLLEDSEFWRNQSDCLVIFLNQQKMQFYSLPIQQDEYFYISDHFYLLPLFTILNENSKFYILTLSLQDIKLFECTRFSITEIIIDDLVPEKLEEVVGYDYENKSLQFRTGHGGQAGALYHGQGAGKDDKDKELEKFLRAVDAGLMKLLNNEDVPLVLACVDYYYPIYAQITNYPYLYDKHISGNHEMTDPYILHEMALPLINNHLRKKKDEYINIFMDLSADSKTRLDINDIIPAAVDGRIDMLFIQKSKDRYGLYDKLNRSLIIDEYSKTNQASLFNLAAIQTWIKGGQVYLVEKDEMPISGTMINALFRY